MKNFLIGTICVILILAISYAMTAGIIWLIFWLLDWSFSWKMATVIWLALILLGGVSK